MKEYKIFTPGKVGSAELKNRIVMSPMTRSRAIGNVPNDLVAFGRMFINNPDLVDRLKNNYPLSEDLKMDLFYTADENGYTDYPFYNE